MRIEKELMRGAGPAAVMMLLERGEKYGYELVQLLDSESSGVLAMGQSTLYPLLYNLQAKGLIASRVEEAENGRPRKYYRLTRKGVQQLVRHRKQWEAQEFHDGHNRTDNLVQIALHALAGRAAGQGHGQNGRAEAHRKLRVAP
jgi:PadR family transcriptional regulator PadR